MNRPVLRVLAAALLMAQATAGHALTWSWHFAGESGTFVTAGTGAPGTYLLGDFSVGSSAVGGTLGSHSGGSYASGGFSTDAPYTFDWDGSAVTGWFHAGSNLFDWIVYSDAAQPNRSYFFGWDTGNVNNPASAAYYDDLTGGGTAAISVGPVTVAVVPEPQICVLMLTGLAAVGWAARRRT